MSPSFDFTGRTAVVSGGAQRIGRAIAETFQRAVAEEVARFGITLNATSPDAATATVTAVGEEGVVRPVDGGLAM